MPLASPPSPALLPCPCRYCEKYGVDLDPKLAQLCNIKPRVPWAKFVNADNQHLASQQVIGRCQENVRRPRVSRLVQQLVRLEGVCPGI